MSTRGSTKPRVLRRLLAASDPNLDDRFRSMVANARAGSGNQPVDVETLIYSWTSQSFERDDDAGGRQYLDEKDYNADDRVSSSRLRMALGQGVDGLRNDALGWHGYLGATLAREIVAGFDHRYVALVRSDGSFDRTVDRLEFANSILAKTMK